MDLVCSCCCFFFSVFTLNSNILILRGVGLRRRSCEKQAVAEGILKYFLIHRDEEEEEERYNVDANK